MKEQTVELVPKKPTAKGSAAWFTGDVWIDPIVQGRNGSRLSINAVHFTPGARTAWHSHSHGQTLHVTEGEGLIQSQDEPVVTIRAGDVVYSSADEWHWHGATPNCFMTHTSITEGTATWGDHTTDAEYHGEANV